MEALQLTRSRWIDALRGAAIAQVLVWHFATAELQKHVPIFGRLTSLTWSGVDLFFVMSGYLIGSILLKNRGSEGYYSVFYTRRVIRILPLYALALAIFFAWHPDLFRWYYLMFGQNVAWASQNSLGPGSIAITWSLAIEEQFYLCLPLMVALLPPKIFPKVVALLALFAPVVRAACHMSGYPLAAYFLLPARMDSLLIGVFIAWAASTGRLDALRRFAITAVWPLGLAFGGLALLQLDPHGRVMGTIGYSVLALFYGCVLVLIVSQHRPFPMFLAPMAWMGLGAYSLYLFHVMILLTSIELLGPTMTAFAVGIAVWGFVAFVCWIAIEKPMIAWGHKHFQYRKPLKRDEATQYAGVTIP